MDANRLLVIEHKLRLSLMQAAQRLRATLPYVHEILTE